MKVKKQTLAVNGRIVTVAYPTIGKSVALDCDKMNAAMQEAAMLHGIGQKLGDAASGGTPSEKFEMACRIRDSILSGRWTLETREVDTTAIVIEAVARVMKKKPAQVEAVLKAITDEEDRETRVKEWRTNLKVKAMIATIRAEAANAAAEDAEDDIEI